MNRFNSLQMFEQTLDSITAWVYRTQHIGRFNSHATIDAHRIIASLRGLERVPTLSPQMHAICGIRAKWMESVLECVSATTDDTAQQVIELARESDAMFGRIPHTLLHTIDVLSTLGLTSAITNAVATAAHECVALPEQMRVTPLCVMSRAIRHSEAVLRSLPAHDIGCILMLLDDVHSDPTGHVLEMRAALRREQSRRGIE